MWEQLKRVIKPNGAIVLFGSEPFSSALRMSNIKQYKYDWTLDKVTAKGHLVAKIRPMQQTEVISVFGVGKIKYKPIMTEREVARKDVDSEYSRTELVGGETTKKQSKIVRTQRYPKTILTFSNASQKNKLHPTQKPVALMEYLIRTYTNEGETVLDFTMGSGTTGVACVKTKRDFIGIELDEGYFKIAEQRIMETEPPIF
jgi:site-specific DNA-methyltransferase (adenine-specific)